MPDEQPGPTGQYPHGKLRPDDKGELNILCGHKEGMVVLDFTYDVSWVGMTPEDADAMADTLRSHAIEARKHPRWKT